MKTKKWISYQIPFLSLSLCPSSLLYLQQLTFHRTLTPLRLYDSTWNDLSISKLRTTTLDWRVASCNWAAAGAAFPFDMSRSDIRNVSILLYFWMCIFRTKCNIKWHLISYLCAVWSRSPAKFANEWKCALCAFLSYVSPHPPTHTLLFFTTYKNINIFIKNCYHTN